MTDDHALGALGALGLGDREEAGYRALLTVLDADGAELAELLRLPRSETGQLLETLSKRGLARMVADGRYAAAAPESCIVTLLSERLEGLRRGYDALAELDAVFRNVRGRHETVSSSETIYGLEPMRSRLLQLRERAVSQIRVFAQPPLLVDIGPADFYDPATDRGVHVRSIVDNSMLEYPGSIELLQRSGRDGVVVRCAPSLPVKLVLVDDASLFIMEPDHADVALSTEHPALVGMAASLFEQSWLDAVPASTSGRTAHRGNGGPSNSDDRMLLTLLLSGLTDQAIAARLGVGLRTVQRRVRDLMDSARVDTRIQLGWKASRKGWVD